MNPQCEEMRPLLMGLMDNELDPDQVARVNEHLQRCQACRDEYEALVESSEMLKGVSYREPGDAELARLWKSPFSRLNRTAGLFLVVGGYLLLIGYVLVQAIRSSGDPPAIRVGLAAIVIGFFILLGSVLRERLHTAKTDPYREVER